MKCPLCESADLSLVKDKKTGEEIRIKCKNQKTEKKNNEFVEVGKCKFKINLKTKLYEMSKEQIRAFCEGKKVKLENGDKIEFDPQNKSFFKLFYAEKTEEEDF